MAVVTGKAPLPARRAWRYPRHKWGQTPLIQRDGGCWTRQGAAGPTSQLVFGKGSGQTSGLLPCSGHVPLCSPEALLFFPLG